jgi:hypothetical protein
MRLLLTTVLALPACTSDAIDTCRNSDCPSGQTCDRNQRGSSGNNSRVLI